MLCRALNSIWSAGYRKKEQRFSDALHDPLAAQQRVLSRILSENHATAFGKRHRLNPDWGINGFRDQVPLGDYTSHEADIEAIRRGTQGILTTDRVTHLIPTSGSTGPRKLIPYTKALKQSFDSALAPWVRSLFREHIGAAKGRAYWSISPAITEDQDAAVPIGFEDDTAYLGPLGRMLVGRLLAVPSSVRQITDISAFRQATLTHLLRARNLSLVSIWHPSFLTLLLDDLTQHWPDLLQRLPRQRARELDRLSPTDIPHIWPQLTVVSAWADAAAALPFDRLRQRLNGVAIQPKGILASECWTTIPYQGAYPLALTSHFFEFLDARGNTKTAVELTEGETYETVVTTVGGLYRYRTADQVRVTGYLHAAPTLQFVGRDRNTSDTCGEKLHESHAINAIWQARDQTGYQPYAVVLGPESSQAPTRYILALTGPHPPPATFAAVLDAALRANPHYDLCRRLNQLDDLAVVWLGQTETIRNTQTIGNTALGAAKPPVLVDATALRPIIALSITRSAESPAPVETQ